MRIEGDISGYVFPLLQCIELLLILPYNTDAPLYHGPFATGGLIVVNTIVLVLQIALPEWQEPFVLQFGVVNPIQWVTNFFMHAGIGHLLGNMLFLWAFGLVVEGKIGWWRFLLLYFSIGVLASAVIQTAMFWSEGGGLGASAAIFGVMAVAMVWAPVNHFNCKAIFIFCFMPYFFAFDVAIMNLAFFYLAVNFLFAALWGFHMSSEVAHLIGAVCGGTFAWVMMNQRWVDCEGYDIRSMLRGKLGEKPPPSQAELRKLEAQAKVEQEDREKQVLEGLKRVESYALAGHFDMALKRFGVVQKLQRDALIAEPALVKIIEFLVHHRRFDDAEPLLHCYIGNYQQRRNAMLICLARICVNIRSKPRKAVKYLRQLEQEKLSPKQRAQVKKTVLDCQKMIDDGCFELD